MHAKTKFLGAPKKLFRDLWEGATAHHAPRYPPLLSVGTVVSF